MITDELCEEFRQKSIEMRKVLYEFGYSSDFSNAIVFFETAILWIKSGIQKDKMEK
jgi:hypothetical protein